MKKIREMYEEDYNLKIKKEMEEDENDSIKILKEMEEMIVDGFNEGMDELYDEEVDELERLKGEREILKLEKRTLERRNQCIVCGEEKNIALLPCGHVPFCADCEFEAMMPHQTDPDIPAEPWPKCPVCRTEIEDTLQVFM